MFCRSLDVLRCRSSVSWSWLLSAVSSSLSDCSSSFEVTSSSLVDWNSSLTDIASSLIAFCSSLAISRSRMALCSSLRVASSSRSSSAIRERSSAGSTGRPGSGSLLGFVEEADQQQFLALALHRLDRDADRDRIAAVAHLRAGDGRARVLPARLLDRRPELVAQPLARHGEQVAAGLARGHPQIAVGRSRVIEALVLAIDQDRSRRIGLEQQPLREVAGAVPRTAARCVSPGQIARAPPPEPIGKSTSPGRLRPICR